MPENTIQEQSQITFCKIFKNIWYHAKEVSFEWSHYGISSTDLKVRTTLQISMTDPGRERVNKMTLLVLTAPSEAPMEAEVAITLYAVLAKEANTPRNKTQKEFYSDFCHAILHFKKMKLRSQNFI